MRIAMVAGEASGDRLGAGLLVAIRRRCPTVEAEGIAGPQMIAAGCRSHYPMERLSVMGLFESFGRYPELIPARARLVRHLCANRPDVMVGIDAPDFNLFIEGRLRRVGVPTVHYVSPSVWAWRKYRIHKIARSVDRMLTLFPFEARFYQSHGVPVSFVGHPLADRIDGATSALTARRTLRLPLQGEVVALLPGSRISELKHLAAPMVDTARWLKQRRASIRFVVPLVDQVTRNHFEHVLGGDATHLSMSLLDGQSHAAVSAADAVLVASGTATLEALLLNRPMVITYRTTALTYRIAKLIVDVPYIGLPNLLAGRSLVTELIQDQAVPERLGAALLDILERPDRQAELRAEFERIAATLRCNADERAADAVLELVGDGV